MNKITDILPNKITKNISTPLLPDAFEKSDAEKIELIEGHFKQIMQILGMDLTDDSLKGTPKRVAKMYVKEIFSGLDPKNMPAATLFNNTFGYRQMLLERNINFYSNCEHHFVPFFGKAHVAYFGQDKVIGLSKLNRIVQYFAKRPQVQERLTNQIGVELQNILKTESVAVMLEAEHLCVASRGVKDIGASTITTFFGGDFELEETRSEFYQLLKLPFAT
jgi:GTP cyclohydrolase IA